MVEVEAGVPLARPLGLLAGEVARVLDRVAEAGRADEGAVAAGEAALGDLVPARVLHVPVEQLLDPVGVELAAHLGGALLGDRRRGLLVRLRPPRAAPISASTSSPRSEPASTRKRCSPSSSSVSARSKPDFARGPVSIETQKQVLPAFEQLIATMKASRAAGLVVGVRVGVADEDLVLDADRGQVAGADAEERVARPVLGLLLVGDLSVLGEASPSRASGWAGTGGASRSSARC